MKKLLRKFQLKLQSRSGETIAETLVTMVILSLAVLMLAGAVVTAARINKKADNTDTAFLVKDEAGIATNITITENSQAGEVNSVTIPVTLYTTQNDYQYYKSK